MLLAQMAHAQDHKGEKFIDARCINPLFRGAKPIYTRDFNKLVYKHYPNANFSTQHLLAGLRKLEPERNLESSLFSNLPQNLYTTNRSARSPQNNKALFEIIKIYNAYKCYTGRFKRSTKASKILSDLKTVFAAFAPAKLKVDYTISNHGAGNRRWKRSQSLDGQSIQELLLKNTNNQQEKNQLLGRKMEHFVNQAQTTKELSFSWYDIPSFRQSQSPILSILSKTVVTYTFISHLKNPCIDMEFKNIE